MLGPRSGRQPGSDACAKSLRGPNPGHVSPFAPASLPTCRRCRACGSRPAEAGIRYKGRTDLLLAVLAPGTEVAGVLTQSKTCSAPVDLVPRQPAHGKARALVVNSGNANAFTGKKGSETTRLTAEAAAEAVGCAPNEVYHRLDRRDRRAAGCGQVHAPARELAQSAGAGRLARGGARHHDHRHLSPSSPRARSKIGEVPGHINGSARAPA